MRSRYIASMLIERDGQYLFIRQNKPGGAYPDTLHIPGGGIDEGETPIDAAIREVEEEVGLKATDVDPVDFDWDVVDYKGYPTLLVFLRFIGKVHDGEAVASSDAKEVIWVPEAELAKHPHNPPSLRLLKRLKLL